MATKITDLTELAVTAASGDFLHIIDVDDTTGGAAGTSKKIQVTNLPGGGGGGVSVTNQADNRIVTATAVTDTLTGETNLTYDGTTLAVTGGVEGSSINIDSTGLASAGDYGHGAELLLGFTGSAVAGECMYLRNTGAWSLAAGTALTTQSTGFLSIGVSADAADGVVTRGIVYLDTDPGGSIGDVVYLSTTNGELSTTPVSSSGNVSRVVGYKLDTNIIMFNPSQDWIELA